MARIRAILVILLLLASLAVIGIQGKISTDLRLFLPEPNSRAEILLHHQLENGVSTRMLFIAFEGMASDELARASDAMAMALAESPLFSKVINRADRLGEEALAFVVRNRYQLSRRNLGEQFSEAGFRAALSDRLAGLAGPMAPLEKSFLRQDPTGEVLALLEAWQGKLSNHKRPASKHGVWFSGDYTRALLLAEIRPGTLPLEIQEQAVSELRTIFERIREPGLAMILTGPAAFAVETGEDIRRDVRLLTWLAVTFVMVFLLLVYRSVVLVLLVFLPLVMGILAATAGILIVHGQIHGITLAFGITLAGVAVDYPIHIMSGQPGEQGDDPEEHVARIWPTLRLGVLSTVIAYAAFLLSGFGGLLQLGQFTISGLLVAAVFSRWVLPMMLSGAGSFRRGLGGVHRLLVNLVIGIRLMRWLVIVIPVVGVVALAVLDSPVLRLNVDTLSPIKESRRAQGKKLRDDLGYWHGGRLLIISAPDKDAVLARSEILEPQLESLRNDGRLSGFDMASQFLPSVAHQTRNLEAMSDTEVIRRNLRAAMADSRFKPGTFAPFEEEIDRIAEAAPISVDTLMTEDFAGRIDPLVFDIAGGSAGVVLLHGVSDETALIQFADRHGDVIYMHLKTAATQLVSRSVDRVRLIMLGCMGVIYLLLWKVFRCPMRPLRILIPTISSAVVTASILVLSGNPLSIFHLISLMLVIGLGLDYALFFNRLSDNAGEWNTTFKSLWICAFTTILVFGILVVSNTPPLQAIGMTVGIGATLCFLFAALWTTSGHHSGNTSTMGS